MALNSKTKIKLIDAICEGPIEGLTGKRKGVFLNETALTGRQVVREGDELPLVSVAHRKGAQDQPLFKEASLANAQTVIENVGEEIGKNYEETVSEDNRVTSRDYGSGNLVRQVRDSEADFVSLVFTVPKLFCSATEGLARGELFAAQIKFRVSIDKGDGSFEPVPISVLDQDNALVEENTIKGISTSPYQFRTSEIDLVNDKGIKSGSYKIKVEKLDFGKTTKQKEEAFEIKFTDIEKESQDRPLANNRANQLVWSSIIVGTRIKTTYPNTALVYLGIDTEEYGTLPSRSYEVKGKKVKIPSNAFVRSESNINNWDKGPNNNSYDATRDSRAFGSLEFKDEIPFDGSLKTNEEWTTCPICCFYDLLTNSRYGAGDFIDESNLNWVDLIELSKYCNALVETEDGFEPRFAINTVIGSQAEAYSVLQDMASVFRGMLFWKADNVQIAADHGGTAANVIHVFSNSNVVDGSFVYSGSSLKTRSTRVRVRYNDPDDFYKPNFVIIEDRELIDRYGVQEKSVVAFGCTSKYQAQRMGKWIMGSEKLHEETVTFSVGLEGLNVLPGQVFEVSDEMRMGTRLAGRIAGARLNFVDLDQTVTDPAGSNDKLSVVMKDGTIETRDIASFSGNRVTLASSFTQVPPDDALYAIKNDSNVLRKYRCLSVAEGEGGVYAVTGVRHVDSIYSVVDAADSSLAFEDVRTILGKPAKPANVKITFLQVDDGRNTTNKAIISWDRGETTSVLKYEVRYKIGEAGNYRIETTTDNSIEVNVKLQPGKLLIAQVQAVGLSPGNEKSGFVSVQKAMPRGDISVDANDRETVILPPDPEDVDIEAIGVDQVTLRWEVPATGQKVEGFVAMIKHSSKTDGSGSWQNSTLLRKVEARTTSIVLPLMNGEYLIKFENEQGHRSANAVSAVINLPDAIPRLNYEVFREDSYPGKFTGQYNDVYYNDVYDGLVLSGTADFDMVAAVDSLTSFDFTGPQVLTGEYFFYNIVDLGAKYSVRMQRVISERGLYLSDLIDDRTENIDIWSDFDGLIPDDTNVQVYFRKNLDTATGDINQNTIAVSALVGDIVQEDGSKIEQEDDVSTIERESVLEFGAWSPLENNAEVGRFFQFKAVLTSDRDDQTPIVDELGVTFQLERRTENSAVMDSGLGAETFNFEKPFYTDGDTSVSVGITALDMEPGDYFVMSEPTATGFTIVFKGSFDVDQLINRRFSYTAVGYGTREVT